MEKINNGESGLSVRDKINNTFREYYTGVRREISFVASQQVKIQHKQTETINSLEICNDIDVLEYSRDKGLTWAIAQADINMPAGSETLWRVSSYKNGMIGNVILKSNIIQ